MKSKIELMFVICWFFVVSAVWAQNNIGGSYLIYNGDQLFDRDEYEITPGGKYIDVVQSVSGNGPKQTYELAYNGEQFQYFKQSLDGIIQSTATAEKDILSFYDKLSIVGALPFEGNLVVLEPTAYTHYSALLNAYHKAEGGKQLNDVVVPSIQDFMQIEVDRHGSDRITLDNRSFDASHYRVVFGKKKDVVNIWLDHDRVVAMYFASKNRYVVESTYGQLYDRIKHIVNRPM